MKKVYKTLTIIGLIGTILSAIFKIHLVTHKDYIVVVNGISHFRAVSTLSNILIVIFVILGLVYGIRFLIVHKKELKEQLQDKVAIEEQKRLENESIKRKEAYRDTSGRLDENMIREDLNKLADGDWINLSSVIKSLYIHSERMDTYQEKLDLLLEKNGAEALDDTAEVLEKAEQQLLQNIRKVLNYMDVLDPSNDEQKVGTYLNQCITENEKILNNVSDFLLSVTEYLNNQGSVDGLDDLNNYKQVLLGTLQNNGTTPFSTLEYKEKEPITLK